MRLRARIMFACACAALATGCRTPSGACIWQGLSTGRAAYLDVDERREMERTEKGLVYYPKGVDTAEFPECLQKLTHVSCSWRGGCELVRDRDGVRYRLSADEATGAVVLRMISAGHALARDPMEFHRVQ